MNKIEKIVLTIVVIAIMCGSVYTIFYVYNAGFDNSSDSYWKLEYNALEQDYNSLEYNYNELVEDYSELIDEYETLYAPSTLIENGTIHWRFNSLDGDVETWTVNVTTYRAYVTYPRPTKSVRLKDSDSGETYRVTDLVEYVQPEFFSKVIDSLSNGRTAKQFVNEVVNLKNQLISYGTGLESEYKWSAETLTEGTGKCADTSILIASLLKAGEEKEDYGMKIYFWYCDADHMTDPQDVNHVIVEIDYSNGDYDLIETTTDKFYIYDQISGWKFEV